MRSRHCSNWPMSTEGRIRACTSHHCSLHQAAGYGHVQPASHAWRPAAVWSSSEGKAGSSHACRLRDPQVKVLDAAWYLPIQGRDAVKDYTAERVPGAQLFDVGE